MNHSNKRAAAPDQRPSTEQRAKGLGLNARTVEVASTTRDHGGGSGFSSALRLREEIAALVARTVPMKARSMWAAASGMSVSWINSCASPADADRRTLRLVDLLFLPAKERTAILAAVEEWAQAVERGER